MSNTKAPTKEQILKTIEELEKNPPDKIGILSDIGIGVVGAAGAGYAASIFGASAVFFGLVPVAAPLAVVAGGAALGGFALVGLKKIFDGTSEQDRKTEILNQLKESLRKIEAKEKASKIEDVDKIQFYTLLKEPLNLELISPLEAVDLIMAVENGKVLLKEAYYLVQDIIKSTPTR